MPTLLTPGCCQVTWKSPGVVGVDGLPELIG